MTIKQAMLKLAHVDSASEKDRNSEKLIFRRKMTLINSLIVHDQCLNQTDFYGRTKNAYRVHDQEGNGVAFEI